ncbi:MAG: ABC transporter permease [Candidatus Riflebacteria bacterium]|nr:ABC transporter permease [Candidatus Riflebacteria bacterium]
MSESSKTDIVINYPSWWKPDFREIFSYRELFFFFAWRDIKVRYKQAVFGFLWAILQPLILMIVFSFFWARAVKIETEFSYPVFVYSGLALWMLISSVIAAASQSMVEHANIIRKVYFPRVIIPVSSFVVCIFDFCMTLLIFPLLMFFWGTGVNYHNLLVCLPISMIIAVNSSVGAGLFFAALNIKYRDFRYVVPFFLQMTFFLTPVLFPPELIKPDYLKNIVMLNPLAVAISLFRKIFSCEPAILFSNTVVIALIISLLLLISGFFFFRKIEITCADHI